MSRDPGKLRVFHLADSLVLDVYRATADFPGEERYGLSAQIRQAAVSAASNMVEGSARRSTREYVYFLNLATGSGFETRYLLDLSHRLGLLPAASHLPLIERYTELVKGLQRLMRQLTCGQPSR